MIVYTFQGIITSVSNKLETQEIKMDQILSNSLQELLKWKNVDYSQKKTHFFDNAFEMISYAFCAIAVVAESYFLSQYQKISVEDLTVVTVLLAACVFWTVMSLRKQRQVEKSETVRQTVIDTAVQSLNQSTNYIQVLQQKMIAYEKQLEEVSLLAKVGEMSYSLVHDMASPLSMLALGSSMLNRRIPAYLGGQAPAELQKALETIDKAAVKLNRIQAIFRKAIKNKGNPAVIETDVVALVSDMFSLFNIAFNEYQVKSEFQTPFEELKCEVLEGVLERILINLIQNALNALQRVESRSLILSVDNFDEKFYLLTLQDSGPGIAKDVLDGGFSRFGSSHFNTGETKGSGFGLYSIKKMVEQMHGAIEIRSSDHGTIFRMKFPMKMPPTGL